MKAGTAYSIHTGWRIWSSYSDYTVDDGGDGDPFEITLTEPAAIIEVPSPSIVDFNAQLEYEAIQHEEVAVINSTSGKDSMTISWGKTRVKLSELHQDVMYMNFVTTSELWRWINGTVVQTWASIPDPN